MRFKINVLITIAVVIFIALSSMQYYLVKTAYEYKVTQFRIEVKDKIAQITDNFNTIDSASFSKKDVLYKQLAEAYFSNPTPKLELKNKILNNTFKGALTAKLEQEFSNEFPNHKIEFVTVLNKFVLYNSNKENDSIFSEKPNIKNAIYGNLKTLKEAFLIRNYVGTTSGFVNNLPYKLLTEDALYVSVKNWELIILKRMALLLSFAILSIMALITMFIVVLKALIKQKNINDIKTDFINNITHELKTPLTTLSISTKILEQKDSLKNENDYKIVLETINRQNVRLQKLIDQILTNSIGAEEIELQKETINVNALLSTIIDDFKIINPTIFINQHTTNELITIEFDKFYFTTAINNILENAVKYGSKEISIAIALEKQNLILAIKDNGIGIPREKMTKIFDKFYRVNQGNIHNTKGLGLGLYYVQQILKAHRSTVTVFSQLGKGSSFIFKIPN